MLRAASPSSNWLFWRRVFVAPACLCAVAALHVYRVSACCQTPWKGGGFGMFSTAESEDSRFLRCWKAETPVVIPKYLAREELRVRAAPTPRAVARLAGLLAESEHAPVVVEVWQYQFDASTGKLIVQKRDEARSAP